MAQDDPIIQSDDDGSPSPAEAQTVEQTAEQMAEQALDVAEEAAQTIKKETGSAGVATSFKLPDIANGAVASGDQANGLSLLNDVTLKVKIELGRTHMYVEDVLNLNKDAVIELDKAAGDPVDIFVNDRLVARGEVLVLNENFCIRVSEIIDQSDTPSSET